MKQIPFSVTCTWDFSEPTACMSAEKAQEMIQRAWADARARPALVHGSLTERGFWLSSRGPYLFFTVCGMELYSDEQVRQIEAGGWA